MSEATFNLTIPFPDCRIAEVVLNSLIVDKEPRRSGVRKDLQIQDKKLFVNFIAPDARSLRVGVNSFLDLLKLVIETVERFGGRSTSSCAKPEADS